MNFSSVPFLFLLQIAFWLWLTRTAYARWQLTKAQAMSIITWLVMLITWGFVTSALSIYGVYTLPGFLRLLPGFWLPLIPMLLSAGLYVTWSTFRESIQQVVAETPPQTFTLIQALRIAAIGGLYKATQGLMPTTFVFVVGFPNVLYGISALVLAITSRFKPVNARLLGIWNLVGIAIIVMTAPFAMQMSLPGPLYIFQNLPDGQALLAFPMVLAPTLVVPFFITINAIVANHLLRKRL